MSYRIYIEKSAQKTLSKIPVSDQDKIIETIKNFSANPRPPGVKKLSNRDAWRIRIGNYRIIYEIEDNRLIVIVINIGHRKDIYRR